MYRRLFAIHSWLGLLSGMLLLMISLSGVMLVFMDELDPVFYGHHFYTRESGNRLSYDSLYTLIVKESPGAQNIYFRDLDKEEAGRNVLFSYSIYSKGREDYIGAAINPYTGAIVSRRSEREKLNENFFGWTLRFHYSLHGGIWGALVVSLLSIAFIGSLVTGLVVYRKYILRVLTFRVKLRFKNWRVISSDLHRIVGVWAVFFNLLIALTGFWMLRYVYQPASYKKMPAQTYSLEPRPMFSIDSALYLIKKAYPDFTAAYLNIPAGDSTYGFYGSVRGQWAVHANYTSFILLDNRSGKVRSNLFINEASFADKLDAAAGPIHFGWYGGWPVKVLYCILGISAPLLSITGFILWWRKRRKFKRVNRPYRDLSPKSYG
jgi:uncharacterized iron-regulated membrane protein